MKSSNVLIADIDTKNFQLKLRAIAKHTAALANELDEIDQAQCPECGSREVKIEQTTFTSDDMSFNESFKEIKCFDCKVITKI